MDNYGKSQSLTLVHVSFVVFVPFTEQLFVYTDLDFSFLVFFRVDQLLWRSRVLLSLFLVISCDFTSSCVQVGCGGDFSVGAVVSTL